MKHISIYVIILSSIIILIYTSITNKNPERNISLRIHKKLEILAMEEMKNEPECQRK